MNQADTQSNTSHFRESSAYRAAHGFLVGRINYERDPKMPYSRRDLNLDRMSALMELLGNPHDRIKLIHVAGTKGKGSTTAFLTSALQSHGLVCGSYTSPHLHHVEERFRRNGQSCEPRTFASLVEQVQPAVAELDALGEEHRVTYFEITTALGFLFFLHEQVDVAVLEVGLGGRLDSTNICSPLASVITSISLDHTKQLGDTLALIAAEKAGIIKPGVPVVSGVTDNEPRDVIRRIAQEKNANLLERDTHFRFDGYQLEATSHGPRSTVDLQTMNGEWQPALQQVPLGIHGAHQAANASVAWATLGLLPDELRPSDEAIRQGFANATCSARVEIASTKPLVILDAAHNTAAAQALIDTLTAFPREKGCERWLVLATTRGKDVLGMLEILLPHFDHAVCTKYENNPRGHEITTLVSMVEEAKAKVVPQDGRKLISITTRPTPQEAWQYAKESSEASDQICITGSFFIAAELREQIVAFRSAKGRAAP